MALRVAQSNAPEIGRGFTASPDHFSVRQVALIAVLIAAIGLYAIGYPLGDATATMIACVALLGFGLPHGSLDIALLSAASRSGLPRVTAVVMLYLGCAATMYFVWHVAPVVALGVFFLLASIHFSEDWRDTLPSFFSIGTAIAILTAPVFFHRTELSHIFDRLTGVPASAIWMQVGVLVAPVALVTALVGIALADRNAKAVETFVSLLGMIVLPPIVGFAIFFCLSHSPVHFASAVAQAKDRSYGHWRMEVGSVTFAAIGIAALVFVDRPWASATDGSIASSFITLSILTVPHMLVPHIVHAIEGHRQPIA